MIRYGLKLWTANRDLFEEAAHLYKQGAFDFIEMYFHPAKPLDAEGLKILSDIPFGWTEISMTLPDATWNYNHLVVRFEAPGEAESFIRVDNLCFDFVNATKDLANNQSFTIYPNPTTGQLNILFSSLTEQDLTLKVMDILGREINSNTIEKGSINYSFNINDIAGIYIIKLTDKFGISSQRKVIKID